MIDRLEGVRELTTEELELTAGGGWANFVNNVTTLASKTIPVTSAVGFATGGPAGAGAGAVIGAAASLGAAVGLALSD
jgi:hypothetical protein